MKTKPPLKTMLANILLQAYNANMVIVGSAVTLALAPNAMARDLANRVMNHIERKESAELAKLVDPAEVAKLNLTTHQVTTILETVVLPKTKQLGVTKKISDSIYIGTGPWGSAYLFRAETPKTDVTHGIAVIYGPDQQVHVLLSGLLVSNWRTEERISGNNNLKHESQRMQLKSLGMSSVYFPFEGGIYKL